MLESPKNAGDTMKSVRTQINSSIRAIRLERDDLLIKVLLPDPIRLFPAYLYNVSLLPMVYRVGLRFQPDVMYCKCL